MGGLNDQAPFEYTFLDESFDNQYKQEVRFGKLTSMFSLLSVVIACMGLLGLVSFTLTRKQKEIGIRKVNGARISEVMTMLNRGLVKLVAIAFVIATPIAWFAMNKWLESFAYKTSLSWWIFALAGLLALVIALLTVSWQSWKAATRNPVEALRHE
ncbi:ABC transporter permease [Prolixibacter bellariivorans]|uniref:ABC transporter permease n=1 Tax=Prolixibacter bellariivorans TaxID=314319 RepID=UPI000471420F|nr:FtsX-like permease family protein [Prolixibacter bellariivorans]